MNVNETAISVKPGVLKVNISQMGTRVRGTVAAGLIGQILLIDGNLPIQVSLVLLGAILASVAILRWDPFMALFEWIRIRRAESPPFKNEQEKEMSLNTVGTVAYKHQSTASNDHRFDRDSEKAA